MLPSQLRHPLADINISLLAGWVNHQFSTIDRLSRWPGNKKTRSRPKREMLRVFWLGRARPSPKLTKHEYEQVKRIAREIVDDYRVKCDAVYQHVYDSYYGGEQSMHVVSPNCL